MANKRQPAGQGPGRTSPPTTSAQWTRTLSLLLLVGVDFVVALMMVFSLVSFVLEPDPAVKAGPMYVTLVLTTGAALLMFFLALNASFLPFISRQKAANVSLVMWAMGATGIVTGLLTVGAAANPFVPRLFFGSLAFVFITTQNARLARAREDARANQAGTPASQRQPSPRSRQRRGGRTR